MATPLADPGRAEILAFAEQSDENLLCLILQTQQFHQLAERGVLLGRLEVELDLRTAQEIDQLHPLKPSRLLKQSQVVSTTC